MKLNSANHPPAVGVTVLVALDGEEAHWKNHQDFRRESLRAGVYSGPPEDASYPCWRIGVFDEISGTIDNYYVHPESILGWMPMPLLDADLIDDDGDTTPIDAFNGQYFFLSNFAHSPITLPFPKNLADWKTENHTTYPTAEHAFQALKTLNFDEHMKIARARTPNEAKKRGRKVHLRADWEDIKIDVMRKILEAKFPRGSRLAEKLKATAGRELIEGNTWGDTFWGVCKGEGQNRLGGLLMECRDALLFSPGQPD